jgi:hypothetical protein
LTPVASGLATCTTDCDNVLWIFLNQVSDTPAGPVYWAGPGLMFGLPALIGLFWGAPLVARELEAGTHRLVWTQSVTHPLAGGEADRRRRGRDGRRGGLQCGPADRFWTLQWRESGLMLGLTALLALFSVWWLRRRLT